MLDDTARGYLTQFMRSCKAKSIIFVPLACGASGFVIGRG